MLIPLDKTIRRLQKVRISLMRSNMFCAMSGIMMMGNCSVKDGVPTAYTDGRNEVYGREFINGLTDDRHVAFACMHENYHKMYRHLTTWKKLWDEDPRLANMACDFHINLKLVDQDPNETLIAMLYKDGRPAWCLDAKFRGMNTKQIFDILKKRKKEGTGKGPPVEGDGEPLDDHGWEDANARTDEEERELAQEVDRAIRQGKIAANKQCGKGMGGGDWDLGELTTPKVNWREELREFVRTTCRGNDASSWRRPNRRFLADDVYMPSMVSERVRSLVLMQDMSGSTGCDERMAAMSEIVGMLKEVHPESVDLLYWGSYVSGHEHYTQSTMDTIAFVTKPKEGGGTEPTVAIPFMKNKNISPDCIIVFTDGYISNWGTDWPAPILWVICGSGGSSITAPVGKTIHVDISAE